ncbi:hypothetical protein [Kingella oralis]|uniref:hypothetical protein n=1 Tax=Kingella oralis TaxID=505 RepID=UPI002D7FD778|nr:hypothetical protein [Kingella oralis]
MSDTQLFIRALGSLKIVSPLSGCLKALNHSPIRKETPMNQATEQAPEYTVIVDISQDILEDDEGDESQALFVACTFPDEADAVKYVAEEVGPAVRIDRFLAGSTPLDLLLITIIGPVSAEEFRAAWLAYCQTDPLLAAYVQATEQAVVVWGNEQGETLGQADLKA